MPQSHHNQVAQEKLLKASALPRVECLHIEQNVYAIEADNNYYYYNNNYYYYYIYPVGGMYHLTGHLLVTPSAKISDILQHDDKMRMLM